MKKKNSGLGENTYLIKDLASRIYKEPLKFNSNKNPIKNEQKI